MVGLPDGKKTLRICITVYTQYRRVTDRETDGQTDKTSCHGIVRAMHTRCAVKIKLYIKNKCIGDVMKGAARRSPNCVRKSEKNTFCGTLVSVPLPKYREKLLAHRKFYCNRLLIYGQKRFLKWWPSAIFNFCGSSNGFFEKASVRLRRHHSSKLYSFLKISRFLYAFRQQTDWQTNRWWTAQPWCMKALSQSRAAPQRVRDVCNSRVVWLTLSRIVTEDWTISWILGTFVTWLTKVGIVTVFHLLCLSP